MRKLLASAFVGLLLWALPALAQVGQIPDWPPLQKAPSSGGSPITVTGYSTPDVDESGSTTTTVSYTLSASAGFIAISISGIYVEISGCSTGAISSVTWNGVTATSAASTVSSFDYFGSTYICSMTAVYYLESPATGSHNLVVTNNSDGAAVSWEYVSPQVIGMTNVATSSPVAATNTANTAGNNTVALSTSAATNNAIRVGARGVFDGVGTTESFTAAGITITQNDQSSSQDTAFFNGYVISTSSGSVNFSTTYSNGTGGSTDSMVVVAFKGTS